MAWSMNACLLAAALTVAHNGSVVVAQDYTKMMRLLKSAETNLPKPVVPYIAKATKPAPRIGHLGLDLNKDINDMEAASSVETTRQRSDVWVQHMQAQLDDLAPEESEQDAKVDIARPAQDQRVLQKPRDQRALPLGGPLSLKNEDTVMAPLDTAYALPALPADPPRSLIGLASVTTHRAEDVAGAAKELLAAPLELRDAQAALLNTPYEPTVDLLVNALQDFRPTSLKGNQPALLPPSTTTSAAPPVARWSLAALWGSLK